jgi:hypothetical protein
VVLKNKTTLFFAYPRNIAFVVSVFYFAPGHCHHVLPLFFQSGEIVPPIAALSAPFHLKRRFFIRLSFAECHR